MDVGCSQWWFTDSTMTPQCHVGSPLPRFPKYGPHLHRYNSIRVHPYAHPQHMKVLKHFIYADLCDMANPRLRYVLFLSRRARTGSVPSEAKLITSGVTNMKKTLTLGVSSRGSGGKNVIFSNGPNSTTECSKLLY